MRLTNDLQKMHPSRVREHKIDKAPDNFPARAGVRASRPTEPRVQGIELP